MWNKFSNSGYFENVPYKMDMDKLPRDLFKVEDGYLERYMGVDVESNKNASVMSFWVAEHPDYYSDHTRYVLHFHMRYDGDDDNTYNPVVGGDDKEFAYRKEVSDFIVPILKECVIGMDSHTLVKDMAYYMSQVDMDMQRVRMTFKFLTESINK